MSNEATLQITTPSERDVVITRIFDAPRELVFDAYTKPELLRRWLVAPERLLEVCEIDLNVGGAYHYVWRGPGKRDVGMFGVYREIARPEKFVRTESWEDWDAGESLVTTVLSEAGHGTLLTVTVLFPSREVRDAVLESGLKDGAADGFNKLDECLVSLSAA